MSLTRLIYASRAADALTAADVDQILEASRRNNGKCGVTGILIYSSREFLQCLEGAREPVNQTYARILGDKRHAEVQILDFSEAASRLFPEWGMHALAPTRLTRQRILRYSEREVFAPTRMSAAGAMALLQDIAAETELAPVVEVTQAAPTPRSLQEELRAKLRFTSGPKA